MHLRSEVRRSVAQIEGTDAEAHQLREILRLYDGYEIFCQRATSIREYSTKRWKSFAHYDGDLFGLVDPAAEHLLRACLACVFSTWSCAKCGPGMKRGLLMSIIGIYLC